MTSGRALVPRSSNVAVPHRWLSLRVSKQGDDDYACGLHCIVTAARQLGAAGGTKPSLILKKLTTPDESRIKERLPTIGLFEKDLRALAVAAGLGLYRPNTHDASQFQQPGWLWMAFALVKFTAPTGAESDEGHYLLVLDHLADEGVLVIADPHPWNPSVYCVGLDDFESAWRVSKAKSPWAAALFR